MNRNNSNLYYWDIITDPLKGKEACDHENNWTYVAIHDKNCSFDKVPVYRFCVLCEELQQLSLWITN